MECTKLYSNKKDCCGCGACAAVCPKCAISMENDEDGFAYPSVDASKCVDCGLCQRVCVFQNGWQEISQKTVFAAVSGNTDVKESASGGMFASIAQSVIAEGGAVYGCAMEYENGQLFAHHICVTEQKNLIFLKGSKYVQSDLGDSFRDIRNRLEAGQTVLFSGTPCQVAGLKSFLRKNYINLLTIDIICHGVPSGKLFREYLAHTESKTGKKITSFRFRDKSQGWKLYGSMTVQDECGNSEAVYFDPEESSYYQMFLNSYTYRENCYFCPYASDRRPGDITIGDFWCVELVHPELLLENGGPLDHEKGVSCLIVNNAKGEALLERYGQGIQRWKSTYENASKFNRQLTAPSLLKPERDKVLALSREGYAHVESWYQRRLRSIKIRRAIRAAVPRPFKQVIKAILGRK